MSGKSAKTRKEVSFRELATQEPANLIVMRVVQSLWPTKTDWNLACRTGASDRLCRYWLQNKYNLSADNLAALLRSEAGFQILDALMAGAKPTWWAGFKRAVRRAELRRQQAELARAIEEVEQSELDI
jgi:hypothetical protein